MSASENILDTTIAKGNFSFGQIFVGMLVEPSKTLRAICAEPERVSLSWTVSLVTIISIAAGLHGSHALTPAAAYAQAWMSAFFGLFRWLILVLSFSLAAMCFAVHKSRARAFLISSGWAQLPLLFLAPLACYGHLFGKAYILAILCVYLWLFCLEWMAMENSFALKQMEVFCLIVTVPALIGLCQLTWLWPVFAETFKWLAK
jgi:hypothetical protein